MHALLALVIILYPVLVIQKNTHNRFSLTLKYRHTLWGVPKTNLASTAGVRT